MELRLNKYIQEKFGISRRKFVVFVQNGDVFVNRNQINSYSKTIKSGDFLEIRKTGIKGKINILDNKIDVILFNKPKGFVCSKNDKHNKTIYDVLPAEFKNYFYIGRLDKDSRGLLIMTNNSHLVDKFQHPSNGVEKEYLVKIDRSFSTNDYKKMKKGILDDGELLQIKTANFFEDKKNFFVKIILGEGKKRHIRRILSSLGYKVLDLERVKEGQFDIGNLREGNRKRVKVI